VGINLSTRKVHPTRLIAAAFTVVILIGTALLMTPVANKSGKSLNFLDALFTSVSAVTVTGLSTVDTETHWTMFGHVVIALLMQVGAFGIVGFGALVIFLIEGRLSLRGKLTASSEYSTGNAPDVRSLLRRVGLVMLTFQLILTSILFFRLLTEYGYTINKALGHSIFHAIASFNNAGFALYADSMMRFSQDPWVIIPIFTTVYIASLGFPVISEIFDRYRDKFRKFRNPAYVSSLPLQWSLNSRIVLWASFFLVVAGALYIGFLEWNNPKTLGPLSFANKIWDSIFASTMPRTAGFNSLDISEMNPATWLGMNFLMFIGGASASTAGGIKVGTFVVLLFVVYTEIRGETAVNIGNRRLPRSMQRQALSIVTITSSVIVGAVVLLRLTTGFTLDQILFEVFSAVGTVGLSTGITADLPPHAKFLLSLLMLFGRLGPIVVATSLALRKVRRHYELPKERPLIG
jgi:potassium uptake TrkH family protein